MFYELWISQRYLRSKQREKFISLTAFISTAGIAVGVIVLIVVIAVMSGFDKYLEDKLTGTNAHLIVNFPAGLDDEEFIQQQIRELPSVVAISAFIAGQAIIKEGSSVIGIAFRGVDTKKQQEVTKLKDYLVEGSLDLASNELVVGRELAYQLGLKIGDNIDLISPTTLQPVSFKIKGIFNSGMYLYDSNLVITSLKGAQDFFKLSNQVPGISIKVDNAYKAEEVKEMACKGYYPVITLP